MTDYTELKPLLDACLAENCDGPRDFRKAVEALFDVCTVETISALIAENERVKARLCVCRDCGGQGEVYSGRSSYQGHNQPPEPDMDVCGTCGGGGVLGPLEDFESLAAERDQLKAENEALRTALIGTHREAFEAYFRCCAIANGKDEAWASKNLERAEDGTYMRAKAYDGWCYWMAAKDFAAETILKEGR